MDKRLWAVTLTGILALLVLCVSVPRAQAEERLFLALQINEGETVIAQPKLLGAAGTPMSMVLADEQRPERTRLELQLMPVRSGDGSRGTRQAPRGWLRSEPRRCRDGRSRPCPWPTARGRSAAQAG